MMDGKQWTGLLAGDRWAAEVRGDEALSRELCISGVPFFVFAGRLGVSGAQPVDVLLAALDRAWSEFVSPQIDPIVPIVEGAVCGPDGCD